MKKSYTKKIAMNSQRKNAAYVNGTIEITLERIQHDIATNSRRQNRREFAFCVSRPLLCVLFLSVSIRHDIITSTTIAIFCQISKGPIPFFCNSYFSRVMGNVTQHTKKCPTVKYVCTQFIYDVIKFGIFMHLL